jgi:hypothetical protein
VGERIADGDRTGTVRVIRIRGDDWDEPASEWPHPPESLF